MELDLIKLITETIKRYHNDQCILDCLTELKVCLEKREVNNDNINRN